MLTENDAQNSVLCHIRSSVGERGFGGLYEVQYTSSAPELDTEDRARDLDLCRDQSVHVRTERCALRGLCLESALNGCGLSSMLRLCLYCSQRSSNVCPVTETTTLLVNEPAGGQARSTERPHEFTQISSRLTGHHVVTRRNEDDRPSSAHGWRFRLGLGVHKAPDPSSDPLSRRVSAPRSGTLGKVVYLGLCTKYHGHKW
jgi:hypothetical protein